MDFLARYHELHMEEFDCLSCHHKYEDNENILDEAVLEEGNPDIQCSSCHDRSAKMDLQKAFHSQCMGCHENLKVKGASSGPRLCGECHTRTETNE